MIKKLKKWVLSIIFNRRYITATETPYNQDFGCITEGYIDKNNVIYITEQKLFK